jgi:EmrB/QacA subfamily drug resistance transporter
MSLQNATAAESAVGARHRWKVLAVVSVAVFVVSLDLFIVNIAFPDIQADFGGTSVSSLSWVLNAYAIVFAALLVPAGRIADRIGRRRGFLVGLTIFLVASALCGLAPSVETLVAARVIQALGAALLMPTSLALLLPEFPPEQRAVAIGIWAAVGGVAAAFGPPIGGLLVQGSWRLVFLVNIPVALGALYYAVRLLKESHDPSDRWPDLLGTVLLAAGIGLLSLGLVKAEEWGWGDPRTLGAFAVAAVSLALFWIRCARHPLPVVDLAMLRVRSFAMANVAAGLFSIAFAAMLLSGVLFMTGVWHDSILTAGLSLSPGPLMAATLSVISGRLAGGIGQRYLSAAGCLLFAAGSAWWLWQLGPEPDYVGEMLPGLIVTGIGVGLVLPSVSSAAAASLPPARFATGSAVLTMSRQLGFVLGVSVLVAILDAAAPDNPMAGFDGVYRMMIVASLLGSLASLAIGRVGVPQAVTPEQLGEEDDVALAVAS